MRIGIQKLKPPQAAAVKNFHRCELKNFTGKRKTMQALHGFIMVVCTGLEPVTPSM